MFRSRKRRSRKMSSTVIVALVAIAVFMGIGYAAISTTLTIDGTSDIDSASWDIHFNNVQVTSGSVAATTPAISNNTSVSFSANLANPGDFYEFKVDVVNAGTLDAKLDGIEILPVLTEAQQNYFKYTVTYVSGLSIEQNDSLAVNTTKTILVRCEYLTQTDTSLYPTEDTSFNFSVSMTYVQGSGIDRRFVFTTNTWENPTFAMGDEIPSSITKYEKYQDIINTTSYISFLRHYVVNGIVTKSYVGFVLDNKPYFLQGGDGGSSYNTNKTIIQGIYGVSNCTQYSEYYECYRSDMPIRSIRIKESGNVFESKGGCTVPSSGNIMCDY